MRNAALHPVFYDPTRVRYTVVKAALTVIGIVSAVWLSLAAWGYVISPDLPAVNLPAPSQAAPAGTPIASTFTPPTNCQLLPLPAAKSDDSASSPLPAAARPHGLSFGFLINWDEPGFNSLDRHIDALDVVVPQWLYFSLDNRMLIEDDFGCRQRVVDLVRERARQGGHTRVMPMVTNLFKGKWQGVHFAELFASEKSRRDMVDQLVDYAETHEFMGISVDFEQLPDECLPNYYAFLAELAARLHANQRQLSVNVPFESETLEFARIAKAADYVIVMAYDEHWNTGQPGPIASHPWLVTHLAKVQAAIPADKLVIALGNYAYDWAKDTATGVGTVENTLAQARRISAHVASDPASLNPTFSYHSPDGKEHQVWFLDAITAFNTMAAAAPAKPAGYALWRLGMEDPAIWEFFGQDVALDATTAARLAHVTPQQVLYQGKGEVLRLVERPKTGTRELWLDPASGLIKAQRFTEFPATYLINRYGAGSGKRLALTFDDGPSPTFTPRVLSILRQNGVKASFFVVGIMGQDNPDLLRQEAAEGHDIGIHTFTHPDISLITPAQLDDELSSSQKLLSQAIGRRSVLFRPPFGRDINPTSLQHLKPVEQITDLGYLTVGFAIDTEDWTNPGADKIVENAIDQAESGGQIIVMHDAGGDREEMLEALPQIIKILRQRGYEFVTVSQMLGLQRDQVMPPVTTAQAVSNAAATAGMTVLDYGLAFIKCVFISGLVIGLIRMALIAFGAIYQRRHARRHRPAGVPDLTISVIVPAHNESKVVAKTVNSLLASEGVGSFDILVVDDGSTDDTYQHVSETFADQPRVRVFTKPNGGKSSANNFGLAHTRSDIVIMLDADTIFQPDTIRRLVAHFSDPTVGAVAGNVKVGNRVNCLTRWQALEYITSQSLDRRALTVINCNNVVPGAIGAWRRDLVMRVGMYNHRTLAEDGDLTLSVCRLGYKIEYEDLAIAWTEAPDTMRGFLRQRFRWTFGTFQVSAKHASALFNRSHPWLGFVGMPNMILFQVLYPLLAPFMDLVILGSVLTMAYARARNIHLETLGFWQFVAYYMLFLTADTLSAALAFALEKNEDRRLLLWVPFQRIFYRFVLYYTGTKSIFAALSGRAIGWGAIQRKATVDTDGIIATAPAVVPARAIRLVRDDRNPAPAAYLEVSGE